MWRLLIVPLLVWWAVCDRQAVSVWASDLTLWRHAHVMAPAASRPRTNYAKALWGAGYPLSAQALLAR